MIPIFDCHAHLISDDHDRYKPAPLSGSLRPGDLDDPMTAERLLREMDANGVERAVVVQRGHVYGFDNAYVCDAAQAHPDRMTAVCTIDGRDPLCADHVRYWVNERGARGIRVTEPEKGADPNSWLSGAIARELWKAATDLDVSVCVHFFRWNRDAGLAALGALLQDFSQTTVVIDHFSNMTVEAGPPDHGVDAAFAALAAFPKVYTKFTTIPLGPLNEKGLDAAPIVKKVVDTFGAERVMWGSDIAQSKGSYAHMVDLGRRSCALLDEAAEREVLNGAARAVYGG